MQFRKSEAPIVVPYQTDWTFLAVVTAPVVLFAVFLLSTIVR